MVVPFVPRRSWSKGAPSCLFFLPLLIFHEYFQLRSMVQHNSIVVDQSPSALEPNTAFEQRISERSNRTVAEGKIQSLLGGRIKQNVLIAQYASCHQNDSYSLLLNATSRVNRAYAKYWGHDYCLLRGMPYVPPSFNESFSVHRFEPSASQSYGTECTETASNAPASRATYNKLALLSVVREHPEFQNRYDRLVILDADAMMYDFKRDIGAWEKDRAFVLAAHRTQLDEPVGTGSINVGVTVWNLRHKLTPFIVQRWKQECFWRIQEERPDDDQAPLQILLKEALDARKRHQVVYAVTGEFEYGRGSFIRHFIRKHMRWNTTTSINDVRLSKIQTNVADICRLHNDQWSFCGRKEA